MVLNGTQMGGLRDGVRIVRPEGVGEGYKWVKSETNTKKPMIHRWSNPETGPFES